MQQVALAHSLCDQGRAAEAEDLCRWVLAQAPNLASAQVALGRSRFEQGALQEARAILEAAADRHPAFFSAQRWLAEVLVRAGDWPRASEILVKAEALSPGQPRIAELVRQVMGGAPAAPPRTDPASVPAGPPDSGPTSSVRRRTYVGPAVADPVPGSGPAPVFGGPMGVERSGPPPVAGRSPGSGPASGPGSGPAVPGSGPSGRLPSAGYQPGSFVPTATAPLPPASPLPSGPPPIGLRRERSSSASPGSPSSSPSSRPATAHGNTPTRRQSYPEPPAADLRGGLLPALSRARARLRSWARHHPRTALLFAAIALFTAAALTVVVLAPGTGPRPTASLPAEDNVPGASLAPMTDAAFDELAGIIRQDRLVRASQPTASVSRALLAEALLASEYGRPAALESEQWADELAGGNHAGQVPEELQVARVLFRVARGERAAGLSVGRAAGLAESTTPLARFAWARLLTRGGDSRGALAHLGDMGGAPFLPARLLLAELRLDAGDPAAALPLIRGALEQAAGQPVAVQQLIEASHALARPLSPADAQLVERSCEKAAGRVPTLAAVCQLHKGLLARRAGQRDQAHLDALAAADLAPPEPRVMGAIAQLLVNTGATLEARALIRRAEALADRRLPPLAWARVGAALAVDRLVPIPPGTPPGPEARLIAARASFVGPRPSARGPALPPDPAAEGDRDLRWVADGARVRGRSAARAMAERVRARYGSQPPGPVASFVAGTLARRAGEKPLARTWLAQSMDGHGDACRAASLYRISLREEGQNPKLNAPLQRAIGRLGCDRLLATPIAAPPAR
jgi:tetratricopeptide (TPR) repeat protein